MSLESVKPDFNKYLSRIKQMAADAQAVEVKNEDSLKFVVALGGEARKIAKAIEMKRKEIIADPSDFIKQVNNFAKQFTEHLNSIEAIAKRKVSDYQYQQELERRKREEAARKAAAELQEKLRREAEEANRKAREEATRKAEEEARARAASEAEIAAAKKKAEEEAKAREVVAPVVQEPIVPKESNVTRSESGVAAYQRKTWTFEIKDERQIPREYLKVDESKIRDAIKMGAREIVGIRIYESSTTVFRS